MYKLRRNLKKSTDTIASSIKENFIAMQQAMAGTIGFQVKDLIIGKRKAFLCFDKDLADKDRIIRDIVTRLMEIEQEIPLDNIRTIVMEKTIGITPIQIAGTYSQVTRKIVDGWAVLFIDGYDQAIAFFEKSLKTRAIGKPFGEIVVRGPQDGFNENLEDNMNLLKQRIKSHDLKGEDFTLGTVSNTKTRIVYMESIVHKQVLSKVRERIQKISLDVLLESNVVEEFIEDNRYSPFPTMEKTVRPDKAVLALTEGRVAIFIQGTPTALLAPAVFLNFFQAMEDYYIRSFMTFFLRLIRILAFMINLLLPAIYVASVTHNQNILPLGLLLSMAAGKEGVPYPSWFESLLMMTIFEILREAGLRFPQPIGQAVSIVGALVIGESAVNAGLISPAMVIVISLTAIASFALPTYEMGTLVRMLGFAFVFLAALMGILGVGIGFVALFLHLGSLTSFGIPYLTPLAPFKRSRLRDTFLRFPWPNLKRNVFVKGQKQ